MKQILFINKKKNPRGFSTDKVIDYFEDTEDLEKIKKVVENAQDRLFVSWATVSVKDKAGELIPMEDIVKEEEILLERGGPISDEHSNRIHGKTLAYKVLEHPETKSMGVLHLNKIFDHNDLDDKIWDEIKSGEREGSSVAGYNTETKIGTDEVTGERAKILEGFHHLETASVRDPCNPMATNEAYSVVAKSARFVKKPEALDRCVQHLMDDPDFKPRDPSQTKEQAAYAVCQAQLQKKKEVEKFWNDVKIETNLNKKFLKKNKGDTMKIKKAISQIEKILKTLKQEEEEEEETEEKKKKKQEDEEEVEEQLEEGEIEEKKKKKQEEEEETEEKKKKQEEEEEPEEKKKKKQEEEEEEVEKEEARSDIEGEEPAADQPENPEPEESNDEDAFIQRAEKKLEKKFENLKNQLVKKISTPRPGGIVNKADKWGKMAMDIATGKKKFTFMEVNKMNRDFQNEEVI